MEQKLKRQQRTVGAVVKIPLTNGFHTYARILKTDFAFYNVYTKDNLDVSEIIKADILFFAAVYDTAVNKGYWLKTGKKLPLEPRLQQKPPVYSQDFLSPEKYTIYKDGNEIPATKEECIGLEVLKVWGHKNMEQRLQDYFNSQQQTEISRKTEKYKAVKMPVIQRHKVKV